MPSGRLCAANVASATSWMEWPFSGSPRTWSRPLTNSMSFSLASMRCAATRLALSITLSQAPARAMPPTVSDREP